MNLSINCFHILFAELTVSLDNFCFQETDFKEWKLVVQEIVRLLKADTAFMNIRPLRYSLVLDPHPDSLSHVLPSVPLRNLRLRDAILSSYHHNEVLLYFFSTFHHHKRLIGTNIYIYIYINQSKDIVL